MIAVQIVAPSLLGVPQQRLPGEADVVMPEIGLRDDVLPDARQIAAGGDDFPLRVGIGGEMEPAGESPGDEEMVVIVPQEHRRHAEGERPVVPQVDVLKAIEPVEIADPGEPHTGALVLGLEDAKAPVVGKRRVAGAADRGPG